MQVPAKRPFVSVVIPCRNEEGCIEACLESVLAQRYPADRLEILVADGRSTDRTRELVEATAARHPGAFVRIIDNPDRYQAPGCNHAIAQARGDVILRMDAHAHYHPNYIDRCVTVLANTGAANVGGAARPAHRNRFQHALTIALKTRLSMGGGASWSTDREGWVDSVWNGAFPRQTFERVGLFDPKARTNEDAELNLRIAKSGGGVYMSREIIAHYYPRSSLCSLMRQYFCYGIGRARTVVKHRVLTSFRPLAPASLVAGLTVLAMSSLLLGKIALGVACALGFLYLLGVSVEAVRVGIRHDVPQLIARVGLILPAMHFAHGSGFLLGIVRYAMFHDWNESEPPLPPRVSHMAARERTTAAPAAAPAANQEEGKPTPCLSKQDRLDV